MERLSDRHSYLLISLVCAASVAVFMLMRLPRAMAAHASPLGDDGPGYYSYLRSVIFDRDLDFRNEYDRLDWPLEEITPTGLVANYWSVGPAILWAPFYLVIHGLSLIAPGAGYPANSDGFGYQYQSAACVGTIVYVALGCILAYRLCRRYTSSYSSLVAVLGLFLGSSLVHYTVAAPGSSHGVSFFAVALFLFLWARHRPRSRTDWAMLGLAAGLMALVRWQDVLFVSVVAVEAIWSARSGSADERVVTMSGYLQGALLAALIAILVFAPQMLAWSILYGSPLALPQGAAFFDPLRPNLLEYLFSTNHGLFTWTPIALLAVVGLGPLWVRDRRTTLAVLTALLLLWYVNSAASDWWAHGSFGARRFVSATAILALALAALIESVVRRLRHGTILALICVASLIGWNFLLDLQFTLGYIPTDEAISLRQMTVGKLDMVMELVKRALARI